MPNIHEQPVEKPPEDRAEKILLAKSLVQFYFAQIDYRNRHPHENDAPESERDKIVESYGQEFEDWYESAAGMISLNQYAEQHTSDEIIAGKNIDELVRSFMAFRNRSSHTR